MLRAISLILLLISMPSAALADAASVNLRGRSYRKWTIQLPAPQWFAVGDGVRIRHAGGEKFAARLDGNRLQFDTDGDGEFDRTINPLIDATTQAASARVILEGKTAKGGKLRYAIRLRRDGGDWEWAPGGALAGSIPTPAGPLPVRLIDQNGNGRFDDVGEDAMIVGTSNYAMFLSRTIVVDGQLRRLHVNPAGTALTLTDYEGPTAAIDMTDAFESKAVLLSAIVRSKDGLNSFDVAAFNGPAIVPVGAYRVVSGSLGLGTQRVRIGAGKMKPIELAEGDKHKLHWGGPARAEFAYDRRGGQIQFSPDAIQYYGAAGEEYFNWNPIGKSPQFRIKDLATGAVLKVAILPGSC
ncbi:MAG: hypothetical protein QGG36_23610 [Pirellulaceae bacterium]|nr:hypothetical protein [Pirellulaceae bacterium]MDP7018808.1 hypothetical protein [Pirellulaceae bacterium]